MNFVWVIISLNGLKYVAEGQQTYIFFTYNLGIPEVH